MKTRSCGRNGQQRHSYRLPPPEGRRASDSSCHWQSYSPRDYPQSEYPDFFFNITNTNDKTHLKAKFARICNNSRINTRYFHCTEDVMKANPSMCTYLEPSFDVRVKVPGCKCKNSQGVREFTGWTTEFQGASASIYLHLHEGIV
ncbi:protein MpPKS/CHS-like2 [Marchantia polymorpha subsp. ruderalis]